MKMMRLNNHHHSTNYLPGGILFMITTDETNLKTYVARFSQQPRYVKYINQVHVLWHRGYTMAGIAHILHIDCACVRYCMHALKLPPNYHKHYNKPHPKRIENIIQIDISDLDSRNFHILYDHVYGYLRIHSNIELTPKIFVTAFNKYFTNKHDNFKLHQALYRHCVLDKTFSRIANDTGWSQDYERRSYHTQADDFAKFIKNNLWRH